MEETILALSSYLPADIDLASMMKFIVVFAFLTIFIGLLGRVLFGTRSALNHAVSSSMGILFLYVVAIVIYAFNPRNLSDYLCPLPFVAFSDEKMYLFSFANSNFSTICSQILSLLILAFLVNLLDTFIPKGKKIAVWFLQRFISVLLSIVLFIVANWLIGKYVPAALLQYSPMILLGFLLVALLVGIAQVVLKAVLTATNPIVGAIYTFFFGNIIGKQLSKAALTTIIITAVFLTLEYFGYAVLSIAIVSLVAYIPLVLALLILWYLIGHIL